MPNFPIDPILLAFVLFVIVMLATMVIYAVRVSRVYRYVKRTYPENLDLFSSLSPRGFLEGFLFTLPPGNSRSIFNRRYLADLNKALRQDPHFSKDGLLLEHFEVLKKLLLIRIVLFAVLIVTLLIATMLLP